MTKIIFFPVGSEQARDHYEKSIVESSQIDKFEEYLDAEGLNKIYYGENKKISIWGTLSTNRLDNIYERIERGDLVMFVQDRQIRSFGMVLMKIKSPVLSEKYWNSNNWSNIIFLTEVQNSEIHTESIWKNLGYKDNFILRGPLRINTEKTKLILEYNEKVRKSLENWVKEAKCTRISKTSDMPLKDNFNPKIFISYSHADEAYKNTLKNHLSVLIRIWKAGEIWDDRKLEAGVDYNEQINNHIEESNICILLISADYLGSTYCMSELDKIINLDIIIIPIIVRACYWKKLFSNEDKSLITFPANNANIFASKDRDEDFTKVVEFIDDAITRRLRRDDE